MPRQINRPSNADAREYCVCWGLPSWQGVDGKASPNIGEYIARYIDLNPRDLKWEIQRRLNDYKKAYSQWCDGQLQQYDFLADPHLQASELSDEAHYFSQVPIGGQDYKNFSMSETDILRMLSMPLEQQESFARDWSIRQHEDFENNGYSLITLVLNPVEGLTAHMKIAKKEIKKALNELRGKNNSGKTIEEPYLLLMVLDGYGLGVSPAYIGKFLPRVGSKLPKRSNADDPASAANRYYKSALSLLKRL